MTKNKFFKVSLLLSSLALILSGCSLSVNTGGNTGSSSTATDGGIFKSSNQGTSWAQKSLVQSVGRVRNFAGADIISLAVDPTDNKAIYAGSLGNGLFYSYDLGESWQVATSLGQITVNSVAIDSADKCTIYAASGNKIFKSSDCSRTWVNIYFDNDLNLKINTIAIDQENGRNIYLGNSRGDIIKSSDAGVSWRAINRFDSQVVKIIISPASAKVIFVGTASKGIYRSLDAGDNWQSLGDRLKAFNNSQHFRDLAIVGKEQTVTYLANNYGLLKSTNNGSDWTDIQLLTPEKEAVINALAVNPKNSAEIYYCTNTTFYRSLDGGKNWTSKKLPTGRTGVKLLIDPINPSIIYLAAKKIK